MDEIEMDDTTIALHMQVEEMRVMNTNMLKLGRLWAAGMLVSALIIRSGMSRK